MLKLGNKLHTYAFVDLLPGVDLPSTIFWAEVRTICISDDGSMSYELPTTVNFWGSDSLHSRVSRDVYSIELTVRDLDNYKFSMRVDRLLLLNLASKLLRT